MEWGLGVAAARVHGQDILIILWDETKDLLGFMVAVPLRGFLFHYVFVPL